MFPVPPLIYFYCPDKLVSPFLVPVLVPSPPPRLNPPVEVPAPFFLEGVPALVKVVPPPILKPLPIPPDIPPGVIIELPVLDL